MEAGESVANNYPSDGAAGRPHLHEVSTLRYSFTPDPAKTFHRGGIDYFLHGRTAHMANWQTPKSTGEYIGKVLSIRNGKIRLSLQDGIALHNGDGLCFGDQGFSVNGVEGDWILPNALPKDLRVDDMLFRNFDTAFVRSLRCERRIPVDILFAETDEGFRLRIGNTEKHFAYPHEPAKNADRALHTLREQLSKLGDTPYVVRQITLDTRLYFLPISVLNAWRREVIEEKLQDPRRPSDPLQLPLQGGRVDELPSTIETNLSPSLCREGRGESLDTERVLMTCRYCLLHEMGHCRKLSPLTNEPRYLRLRNGTILRLHFDCHHCEMLIMNHETASFPKRVETKQNTLN